MLLDLHFLYQKTNLWLMSVYWNSPDSDETRNPINLGLKEVQRDVFLSEVGEKKIKQVCIEYCLKT